MSWRVGWTPLSTARFGWSVNMRSIQEEELGSKWVGSDTNWWNPYVVLRESIWCPSNDVMSSDYHDWDLALKSPSITVKEDLSILTWFNNLSKLTKNSSNSLLDWLGDLYITAT